MNGSRLSVNRVCAAGTAFLGVLSIVTIISAFPFCSKYYSNRVAVPVVYSAGVFLCSSFCGLSAPEAGVILG